MPRTKKVETTTAYDEKAVEEKEVQTEVSVEEKKPEPKETPKTENRFYDDDSVKIVSLKRAGKKIVANTGKIIEFDSNGAATVSGVEAKYLLSCPGIELAK